MKITETQTKSITFIFNKEDELTFFKKLLRNGCQSYSNTPMTESDAGVISSIERNLIGIAFKAGDNITLTEDSYTRSANTYTS
jgi:hypothetical protein